MKWTPILSLALCLIALADAHQPLDLTSALRRMRRGNSRCGGSPELQHLESTLQKASPHVHKALYKVHNDHAQVNATAQHIHALLAKVQELC
ncbi:uncharacterized protein MJAP1_000345 [Malassezia japonica]|uniref:Uncharacterized protein n=1 Tax=Malassezia japonica TaxID=223818 RepID=A0AAF0EUX0_9BASI|nr:uncharacterized protein MJAP1_000345 [Malassezia japonica]WFD37401.1 hypothetical protein MJAP1_000345 [Malassezia japonica]